MTYSGQRQGGWHRSSGRLGMDPRPTAGLLSAVPAGTVGIDHRPGLQTHNASPSACTWPHALTHLGASCPFSLCQLHGALD